MRTSGIELVGEERNCRIVIFGSQFLEDPAQTHRGGSTSRDRFKSRAALAEAILDLSDRLEGKPERPMPDLPSALTELERTVATQIHTVTDANVAAQIHARLALYQETVPFAMKLTKL